jgi:hypothetical protein
MPITKTIKAPRIVDQPKQRMAVVETVGDPALVGEPALDSLYGAIAACGSTPGSLRARWPNARDHERTEWRALWALPVSEDASEPGGPVRLETWYGGLVAEILHEGPFDEDGVQAVKRLRRFIVDCGYEIAGPAEEEYVTAPGDASTRTIIRYEVHSTQN